VPQCPLECASEAAYRQALALAEALGTRPFQAHCHQGLGALAADIALYRAMDMTFWLPQAEAALAQVA